MTHILIISAPYYTRISDMLERGAKEALDAAGATYELAEVPGALEIPGAIAFAAGSGKYDGYIALGCVIRGETSHYDIVAGESARGLNDLVMNQLLPIGNAILTVENEDQAIKRADPERANKGGFAANTVLTMCALKSRWGAHDAVK